MSFLQQRLLPDSICIKFVILYIWNIYGTLSLNRPIKIFMVHVWFMYNLDGSTMHLKFDPIRIQTHDP